MTEHPIIGGAQVEAMLEAIRTEATEAGRAAGRLQPECLLSHVALGTGAMAAGISMGARSLTERIEVEGPQAVADCAAWLATAMWHNGEITWRRVSNTPSFAPHCADCGGATYVTGYAQFRAGMAAYLQALCQIAVIQGGSYEINPLRARAIARTCEADLQRRIREVFDR